MTAPSIYMTARTLVTQALKDCGQLGVGQTALAEDIDDGFFRLQNMMALWQKKRWLVPSLFDISMPGNSQKSNKIGDGQYYNTPRPDKIQAGYIIQLNTGSNPVSLPLWPLFSYEDYARISVKDLNTLPTRFFYDGAFPYGNVYIWPIPNEQYEIHLIIKSQLGFATSIASGVITTGGVGYVNGNYIGVPLTGGDGLSATADITVTAGVVTVVTFDNPGLQYNVGNVLSASNADLGGTGAGFTWTIDSVTSTLDSVLELPPEYYEALLYNLSLRLSAMYQLPAQPDTLHLAKASLNVIKVANTQVPSMVMPPTLRRGKSFNIYSPDSY